jgi:hypothetical protein
MPDPVKGHPLFLIFAWLSGYRGGRHVSDMQTLRDMIGRFCQREHSRFAMSEAHQMEALRQAGI